jgi:hypothetical protein
MFFLFEKSTNCSSSQLYDETRTEYLCDILPFQYFLVCIGHRDAFGILSDCNANGNFYNAVFRRSYQSFVNDWRLGGPTILMRPSTFRVQEREILELMNERWTTESQSKAIMK